MGHLPRSLSRRLRGSDSSRPSLHCGRRGGGGRVPSPWVDHGDGCDDSRRWGLPAGAISSTPTAAKGVAVGGPGGIATGSHRCCQCSQPCSSPSSTLSPLVRSGCGCDAAWLSSSVEGSRRECLTKKRTGSASVFSTRGVLSSAILRSTKAVCCCILIPKHLAPLRFDSHAFLWCTLLLLDTGN